MSVEYDLVIIGYTPEGAYAAMNAALLNARVALVAQNCLGQNYSFYSYGLRALSQQYYQGKNITKFGFSAQIGEIDLQQAMARIEKAIATISEQNSPAILSAAGVDFIEGRGEFCRRPHLAFIVGERKLRSRSYLLAMGFRPQLPGIKNLSEIGYLTPDRLWKSQNLLQLPKNLAIVGGTPLALELAQSLTQLGNKVTLIIEGKLLAREEPEATRIIQAQLEAEGIALFTHSPITQVQKIANKKWLQVGDRAIETDEIIWAVGYRPNLENLNLEGLGINPENPQIDAKLQTHHARIYFCSGIENEFALLHLSRYQADVALHNALYFPTQKCDRQKIPRIIFTDPKVTRIGLTERDAKNHRANCERLASQKFKN
jgi:pyruvate/2-oxoglutarate dehydrogenase complex dihydrolipoamide dehydrogenase (E3) component